MSVVYRQSMELVCDVRVMKHMSCNACDSFNVKGEGKVDWKDANKFFYDLGWRVKRGKNLCPYHASKEAKS